jgi:hypothetical protein
MKRLTEASFNVFLDREGLAAMRDQPKRSSIFIMYYQLHVKMARTHFSILMVDKLSIISKQDLHVDPALPKLTGIRWGLTKLTGNQSELSIFYVVGASDF